MNTRTEAFVTKVDNYIDSRLPQSEEATEKRKNRILKPLAILGIGAVVFAGVKTAEHAFGEPSFSETTTTYTVQPGDGLMRAAEQVEGVETIDIRDATAYIGQLPENQEVLEDGLQPGEVLVIPESVDR